MSDRESFLKGVAVAFELVDTAHREDMSEWIPKATGVVQAMALYPTEGRQLLYLLAHLAASQLEFRAQLEGMTFAEILAELHREAMEKSEELEA